MKNKKIKPGLVLTLSLLLLLVLTGCSSKTGQVQQKPVEVIRGDLVLAVSNDGDLSLPRQRKLTFSTSGKISEINVEEGDRAIEGQVLARLELHILYS